MNKKIRRAIKIYVKKKGTVDSRMVIELFAKKFSTTRHQVSGNISYMVCKQGSLSIIRNKPHSILY